MSTSYATDSYVVNPNDYPEPECPPEDVYTLKLMGIKEIGLGKPFKEGDEPRVQFTLEFKIDAPPGTPQEDWHDFDLIGWYTPILHYPEGATYQAPKMWALLRALNGGTPHQPAMFVDHDGVEKYDAAVELRKFFGKTFRTVIGKSAKGWPKITGDPMPVVAAGTRRRGQAQATPKEAPAAADDGDAEFEGDNDL